MKKFKPGTLGVSFGGVYGEDEEGNEIALTTALSGEKTVGTWFHIYKNGKVVKEITDAGPPTKNVLEILKRCGYEYDWEGE